MATNSIGSSILSSFGVGKFDVNTLATTLANAGVAAQKANYTALQTKYTNQLNGMNTLQQAFKGLQVGLADLGSASTFTKVSATSSDSTALGVTVTGAPTAASYNVTINSLAQAHSVASQAVASQTSSIGTGTFNITVGGVAKSITIDSTNNTLAGLRDAVNQSGLPVNAAIVNDGTGYRLLMSSQQSGASNAINVSVVDSDGNNTDTSGLSAFASNNLTTTVAAQDASYTVNGLAMTSSTNTITGVIDGVTLNLNQANVGVNKTVTVAKDTSGIADKVKSMVDDYNAMIGIIGNLGAYSTDEKDPTKGSLAGNAALRQVRSDMRDILNFRTTTGSVQSLADVGVMTNRDGTLGFDQTKLATALANDPTSVSRLFAAVGTPSDSQVKFIGATDKTVEGSYGLTVTQAAQQALYLGTAASGSATDPMTIDATNNSFALTLNGTASTTLSLAQGTYSRTTVASMLQAAINNDPNLKAKNYAVNVTFDSTNNRFQMTTRDYGSTQSINFTSVGSGAAASLGLNTGSGDTGSMSGTDVLGSLTSSSGTNYVFAGVGQDVKIASMLTGAPYGLEFSVGGTTTGSRGTIDFNRGYASAFNLKITNLLDTKNGLLGTTETGITAKQTAIADQLKKLDDRYNALLTSYTKQFSAANDAQDQMKSLSASLAAQFGRNSTTG
ncbi:MAG: flagellar filament capping protein FliD [Thiotrichales bacterium]|jgi:flagellar hook-associated protein 2|nr:flagellar filament capping protein FliD [Thiotrichales bacterium]